MCDGLKIVTSKLHSGCLYVRGDSLLLRSTQQLTLTLAMSYKPSFFMLQHFPLWGPFPRGNHSSSNYSYTYIYQQPRLTLP